MRTFQTLIVGSQQREPAFALLIRASIFFQELLGFLLMKFEERSGYDWVRGLEIVGGKFRLPEQPDLPVSPIRRPANIIYAVNALQVRADAVQTVGQFDRDRVQVQSPALLKVSKLGDLKAIEKHLPTHPPCTQCGRLPIVFLKAHIMLGKAQADCSKALQVKVLHIRWGRFQNNL